jgi:hypothetical protein
MSGDGAKLPDLVGVSLQERVLLAKEKFETALAEFEYCADLAEHNPHLLRSAYDWNSGMALFVLRRFDEGCARCLQSLRKHLEEQLVNVDVAEGTKARNLPAVLNSSTNELFNQIEKSFHCASMLAKQQAESSGEDGTPREGVTDAAREAFVKLRTDGAAVIVESVLSAQRRLSSPSSRVIGTLLKGAHYWDPNVVVPEELIKAQAKVPAPLAECGACGIPNPSNRCPCGNAHYCSRDCQIKVWKEHKSDCAFHKQRNGKK